MSVFGASALAPAASSTSTGAFGAFGQQQNQQQQQQQQQQQPATSTSLFGGGQSTGTGLFGTNTANSAPTTATNTTAQPTTGLFGQSTTSAQPSTGLFGQNTATTQPSTGLFGQSTTTAQPSTGLFGQSTTAAQPQQQQQSTGPFGQPKPLFGATTTAPATTGLFGPNTQSQTQTQVPSLFGGNTQTQQSQQTASNPFQIGGFGSSTANPTQQNSIVTPSLFGQTTVQSQPLQQSVVSNLPIFTRSTKFNDLPEDVRKKFEQLDSHIQGRLQISNELKQHKLGEEPQKGSEQIRIVHKDLVNSINKLRTDIASMRELKSRMDQAVQDTIAATRIIEAYKNPQNAHAHAQQSSSLKNYAGFPLEFFTRVTEHLRERLTWVNSTLEQIERKLVSEANHISVTPQSITSTLQAQHASFVALASKAAGLDAELQKLKNTYRALWRARTGSARDPFDERDRGGALGEDSGEFGLEGLSVSVK